MQPVNYNEYLPVDATVVLRCGLKANIIQERSVDGYYLFYIYANKEIHRLSEWNIAAHIPYPTWEDYGLQV